MFFHCVLLHLARLEDEKKALIRSLLLNNPKHLPSMAIFVFELLIKQLLGGHR